MPAETIVVIGASAGGISALRDVLAGFTAPLAAPILVVLHIGAQRSELPTILSAAGPMPAKHGEDGETIRAGQIYIAPPDRHMMLEGRRIRLSRGPKENWARPAIDPLFRSAAHVAGPAAVGILLTGNLNDGSAGLYEIKQQGGTAIVQDPRTAAYPQMPRSGADQVDVDYCVDLEAMPRLLTALVDQPTAGEPPPTRAATSHHLGHRGVDDDRFERPVTLTCPDCGGALRREEVGGLVSYVCHTGHAYSAEAMGVAQFDQLERVMRSAERLLGERADFCRQMAERAAVADDIDMAETWRRAGEEALGRAYTLRNFIEQDWMAPDAAPPRNGEG